MFEEKAYVRGISVVIYHTCIRIYREYFIFIQVYFVAKGLCYCGSISYIAELVRARVTLVSVFAFQ